MERFEVAEPSGINLPGEVAGTIPTPEWKRQVFDDDWRLGDTYFTAIGQYGFLATPIAMLRAYAALAGGMLLVPQIELGATPQGVDLQLDAEHLRVVQEGMRAAVIEDGGTARALERSDVAIAAKSGTAELDATNTHLNSWIAGYFPYEAPRFAFILLMEQGPYANTTGAGTVMGTVFDWIAENRPEYLTAGR
jgi:penicillin-binding protein 2